MLEQESRSLLAHSQYRESGENLRMFMGMLIRPKPLRPMGRNPTIRHEHSREAGAGAPAFVVTPPLISMLTERQARAIVKLLEIAEPIRGEKFPWTTVQSTFPQDWALLLQSGYPNCKREGDFAVSPR